MNETRQTIAGFCGKLPSRGDFVSRGLPRSFLEPWTTWMNEGLRKHPPSGDAASAAAWSGAPAWNFSLAPGFAGPSPAAGFFLPSIDRVGRHYPLTVAVVLPQGAATPDPASFESWFQSATAQAQIALADGLSPDAFFEALAGDVNAADARGCHDSVFWILDTRLVMAGSGDAEYRTSAPLLAAWSAVPGDLAP